MKLRSRGPRQKPFLYVANDIWTSVCGILGSEMLSICNLVKSLSWIFLYFHIHDIRSYNTVTTNILILQSLLWVARCFLPHTFMLWRTLKIPLFHRKSNEGLPSAMILAGQSQNVSARDKIQILSSPSLYLGLAVRSQACICFSKGKSL